MCVTSQRSDAYQNQTRHKVKFGQIILTRPSITEKDGQVGPLFPQEARLRNLTYSATLMVEITEEKQEQVPNEEGLSDWSRVRDTVPKQQTLPLAKVQ
jgi:DNA-directed RNA polymerase II subunit RPB2